MYVYKWETCAICFEPVRGTREGVYLACQKHCFHGRCIVPHLQQDRRCPTCRHAPMSREDQAIQAAADMAEESDDEADSDDDSVYEEATTTSARSAFSSASLSRCSTRHWFVTGFQENGAVARRPINWRRRFFMILTITRTRPDFHVRSVLVRAFKYQSSRMAARSDSRYSSVSFSLGIAVTRDGGGPEGRGGRSGTGWFSSK